MQRIELGKQTRDALSRRLAAHLKEALDVEIDPVDAQRLLDFMSETFGPHYYNQGLYDAQAIIKDRADTIVEAVYAIEKPVKA